MATRFQWERAMRAIPPRSHRSRGPLPQEAASPGGNALSGNTPAGSPVECGRRVLATIFVLSLCAGVLSPAAQAHGGLSMEKDLCKLRLGPYSMHFTGYQPELSGANEFCEDIPRTGQTVVALDAVDEALRDLPLEVRIIRDTGDESNLEAITVLHLPAKKYPAGTVSFEHRFDEPGKFIGLVMGGEKHELMSRFPFSVAAGKASREPWLWGIGIVLAGVLLYLYSNARQSNARG